MADCRGAWWVVATLALFFLVSGALAVYHINQKLPKMMQEKAAIMRQIQENGK